MLYIFDFPCPLKYISFRKIATVHNIFLFLHILLEFMQTHNELIITGLVALLYMSLYRKLTQVVSEVRTYKIRYNSVINCLNDSHREIYGTVRRLPIYQAERSYPKDHLQKHRFCSLWLRHKNTPAGKARNIVEIRFTACKCLTDSERNETWSNYNYPTQRV